MFKKSLFSLVLLMSVMIITTTSMAGELPDPGSGNVAFINGVISQYYIYAQTAKKLIYTYADNEEQFNEFIEFWNPILTKYGLLPTKTEFKNGMGIIYYKSDNGLVLRSFVAEKLNYDALNQTAMNTLRDSIISTLNNMDMPVVASFNIKLDAFRPTFNLYYLTNYNENADHEIQLRQLKNGNDIDFDLLNDVDDLKIIREDSEFSMLYAGALLGFKGKAAKSEEQALLKLRDYKKFLQEHDKEFIDYKLHKLEKPFEIGDTVLTHVINMYFWQ